MPYKIEVTDTFGGEANYSWVKRYVLADNSLSQRDLVRKAKALAGWTGMRADTDVLGDNVQVKPRHACWIMFIDWIDDDDAIRECELYDLELN